MAYMCHLASSVQQGCHCIAIHCDLFLIVPRISLAQGSGFKNFVGVLLLMVFLAILLPPILVDLEMVGECLGVMGLFMHSLPVTAPCLLAWDSSF